MSDEGGDVLTDIRKIGSDASSRAAVHWPSDSSAALRLMTTPDVRPPILPTLESSAVAWPLGLCDHGAISAVSRGVPAGLERLPLESTTRSVRVHCDKGCKLSYFNACLESDETSHRTIEA